MNHIQVVSFFYGIDSEGIVTARLVRALRENGNSVGVICAAERCTESADERDVVKVRSKPFRPATFYRAISRAMGTVDSPFYCWLKRVQQLRGVQKPRFVYGRAQPSISLAAAVSEGRRQGVPVGLHFSDPMPSPWLPKSSSEFLKCADSIARVLEGASFVSFTTEAARDYMLNIYGDAIRRDHAVVIPNIHMPFRSVDVKQKAVPRDVLYLGSFYEVRSAEPLIHAFSLVAAADRSARMKVIGPSHAEINALAQRQHLEAALRGIPYTISPEHEIDKRAVLLCLDAFRGPAVFMPTKILDYLTTRNPIVTVTPTGSPSDALLRSGSLGAVVVNTQDPSAIAAAILTARTMDMSAIEFEARRRALAPFSPNTVAARLLRCAQCLGIQ